MDRRGRTDINICLDDIITETNRYTPDQLATVIDVCDLRGTGDTEDTAAGNFLADRIMAAGLSPACYAAYLGPIFYLYSTRTRALIGEGDATGTIQLMHELITDGATGFDYLHDDDDPEPLGQADRAEIDATA